jgi:hypothetical protein
MGARGLGRWWWAAVVGVFLGGEALALFIDQFHRFILWVVIAALAIALTGSLVAYHRLRLAAVATRHTPRPPARADLIPYRPHLVDGEPGGWLAKRGFLQTIQGADERVWKSGTSPTMDR